MRNRCAVCGQEVPEGTEICGECMWERHYSKTCRTCADNDDGLCDRTGYLVDDDDICNLHRDCGGCFGASFGDCQKCQESRKKIIKEEDATVGETMEEIANALQELFRCIPSLSKEDIELVRRNPSISFLQKLRIIRRIRKSMKNEKKKRNY